MIENPMVIGDYYADEMKADCTCEHCGEGWREDQYHGGWEGCNYDGGRCFGYPLHGNFCHDCIMDSSTPERAVAFVAHEVEHDDRWSSSGYTINSDILPRIIMWWMGGDIVATNCGGTLDKDACKAFYEAILRNEGSEQIEEIVKDLYADEYGEFLEEVEDGWHKEVK